MTHIHSLNNNRKNLCHVSPTVYMLQFFSTGVPKARLWAKGLKEDIRGKSS